MALLKREQVPVQNRAFGDSSPTAPAAMVRARYYKALQAIRAEMSDYWLNHAYLHGHQWLVYNPALQRLDDVPRDPDRIQATINMLWPNTRIIISTLMQRQLHFEVVPTDVDDSHKRGARLAEAVLRALQQPMAHDWERRREELLYAVWKGGTAAIAIDWDEKLGDPLASTTPGESPIKAGDSTEDVLNITQFVVEPGVRDAEKARWWIKAVTYPPEDVKARFGLSWMPAADASAGLSPFQHKLLASDRYGSEQLVDLTQVLTYYERPNEECPEGKVLVVVNDQVVFGPEKWPFPWDDRLNLAIVRETVNENRWTGDTVLSMARPVQVLYNVSQSSISEHMKLAGNARLLIPQSALDLLEDLSDLPGEVVPYNDGLETHPSYLSPPQMPAWWVQQPDMIKAALDDIMGVHDISRGDAPPNIESGYGLSILAEKDTTPVGRLTKESALCWSKVASMSLQLYEAKARKNVERKAVIRSPGQPARTVVWNGDDFRGQTYAMVPEDAILPRSRASQMEFAKEMLAMYGPEFISPTTFMAIAELPGQTDLVAAVSIDVDRARRENQQLLLGRQCVPREFDDHQLHISEHNKARKTPDYELMSPEDQEAFDDHIEAHYTLAAEEMGRQRAAGAIDPALAQLPGPTEAPLVDPVAALGQGGPSPAAAGPVPSPTGEPPVAEPAISPATASEDVLSVLDQLGSAPAA